MESSPAGSRELEEIIGRPAGGGDYYSRELAEHVIRKLEKGGQNCYQLHEFMQKLLSRDVQEKIARDLGSRMSYPSDEAFKDVLRQVDSELSQQFIDNLARLVCHGHVPVNRCPWPLNLVC